jgi:hypothetical protein
MRGNAARRVMKPAQDNTLVSNIYFISVFQPFLDFRVYFFDRRNWNPMSNAVAFLKPARRY